MEPDPYAPPAAELAEPAAPAASRTGWKIYLWLLGVAVLLSLPIFLYIGNPQLADAIDLGATATSVVGLFGYAYRRAIGSRGFWALWLPVQAAWELLLAFVLEPHGLAYDLPDAEPTSLVETAISFALLLPLYVALYRYGFRSQTLWDADATR